MSYDICADNAIKSTDLAELNPVEFNCYNVITAGVISLKAEANTFQIASEKSTFNLMPL